MLKSIINDFKREIFVSYDKLIWEFKFYKRKTLNTSIEMGYFIHMKMLL